MSKISSWLMDPDYEQVDEEDDESPDSYEMKRGSNS